MLALAYAENGLHSGLRKKPLKHYVPEALRLPRKHCNYPPETLGKTPHEVSGGSAGGNTHAAMAAFSSLSDLTALWPYLDDQQHETVLDVAKALAKANVSTPSTLLHRRA